MDTRTSYCNLSSYLHLASPHSNNSFFQGDAQCQRAESYTSDTVHKISALTTAQIFSTFSFTLMLLLRLFAPLDSKNHHFKGVALQYTLYSDLHVSLVEVVKLEISFCLLPKIVFEFCPNSNIFL